MPQSHGEAVDSGLLGSLIYVSLGWGSPSSADHLSNTWLEFGLTLDQLAAVLPLTVLPICPPNPPPPTHTWARPLQSLCRSWG